MKVTKINSLFSRLTLFALLVALLSSTGCNKEQAPIVLTGSWDLDTTGVMVYILYVPEVALQHPASIAFLEKNLHNIRRELMKPQRITFITPNIAEYTFYPAPIPVQGTFVQDNALFTIFSNMFPGGIIGASDNIRLELYYSREHLMAIINNLITAEDDFPQVFNALIDRIEGVGAYKKKY